MVLGLSKTRSELNDMHIIHFLIFHPNVKSHSLSHILKFTVSASKNDDLRLFSSKAKSNTLRILFAL